MESVIGSMEPIEPMKLMESIQFMGLLYLIIDSTVIFPMKLNLKD